MSQEFKKPPTSTTYTSGTTCPRTGLYKASDGKMEFVELVRKGDPFPKYPGGTGTNTAYWTAVTEATDGNKTSYDAVKVSAGTI